MAVVSHSAVPKIRLFAGLFLTLVVAGRPILGDPESPAPDLLVHDATGAPIWVSAEAADRDGDVRFELFDRYAADDVDRLRERIRQETAGRPAPHLEPRDRSAPYLDEDLCTATDVVFSHRDDPKPRDTLGNLQRHALAILAGEVVGVEQGFLAGQPTSLLTVEVGSTLRASGELAAESPLYVAYPYAVFAIGSDVFCTIDPRFDYRPKVGDRLLLFPSQPHRRTNNTACSSPSPKS